MPANLFAIGFTHPNTEGYAIRDFFNDIHLLEDGETFLDRVNASFASDGLAINWLRKSYRGKDGAGVGVTVNGDVILWPL